MHASQDVQYIECMHSYLWMDINDVYLSLAEEILLSTCERLNEVGMRVLNSIAGALELSLDVAEEALLQVPKSLSVVLGLLKLLLNRGRDIRKEIRRR